MNCEECSRHTKDWAEANDGRAYCLACFNDIAADDPGFEMVRTSGLNTCEDCDRFLVRAASSVRTCVNCK